MTPSGEQATIHSHIIANIDEGIITVGLDGTILDFNPAAARLLGMVREEALGEPFGTLFLLDERNDAFAQTVIDAVYEADITHNRVVRYHRPDGSLLPLALSTSFLKDDARDTQGVIVVFRDISELERLREEQRRLNEELQGNNHKLAEAVLAVEHANAMLQTARQRGRAVRVIVAAFLLLLLLGLGSYSRYGGGITVPRFSLGDEPAPLSVSPPGGQVLTVAAQPFRSSIKLTGFIEPLRVINVVSSLDGHVQEKAFRYGAQVERGQRLFRVGIDETRVKHREARAAYITALEELNRLENWQSGAEVVRARRTLARAKFNLATLRQKSEESKRLLEMGIIPVAEDQSQQEQLANGEMEYQTAEDDLQSVLAQGGEEQRTVARLKLENAEYQMNELQQKLDSAVVVAPVSGVVLQPSGPQAEERRIEVGSAVQEGAVALSIGDLEGVSVRVSVDEIEIGRMAVGQQVLIRNEAFHGVELHGEVARVSSQASKAEGFGGGVPTFAIDVQVEHLDLEQRQRIRVGMSADLEVLVHDNPQAVLVPLSAVTSGPDGTFVMVLEGDGEQPRRQEVETGLTSLDQVEILHGVEPGMRLLVAGVAMPPGRDDDSREESHGEQRPAPAAVEKMPPLFDLPRPAAESPPQAIPGL